MMELVNLKDEEGGGGGAGGTLICKAKSVASSLYGLILWTSSTLLFHQDQQLISKNYDDHNHGGLKTLIQENPSPHSLINNVIHSYTVINTPSHHPPPPPPPSSLFLSISSSSVSSMLGDLIGAESGVAYINDFADEMERITTKWEPKPDHRRRQIPNDDRFSVEEKTYPPPIPLLARTGNLPGHMPWVLTRHYTDGKLILTEERVKHHDYFFANRTDGRLVLKLVSMDDTIHCCHDDGANKNYIPEEDDEDIFDDEEEDNEEFVEEEEKKEDDDDQDEEETTKCGGGGGVGEKACSVPKNMRKCCPYVDTSSFSRGIGSAPLAFYHGNHHNVRRFMTAVI